MCPPDDGIPRTKRPRGRAEVIADRGRIVDRDLDAAARGGGRGHRRDPRGRRDARRGLRGRRARRSAADVGRARRPSSITLPPMPSELTAARRRRAEDDEALSVDELRDAWPLLDLDERGDGLRVLPREDAEEFFIALPAHDQAQLVLHFRPGQRRQWMRMLEPDDVADVDPGCRRAAQADAARAARRSDAQGSRSRCSRTPRTRPAASCRRATRGCARR